MRKRVLICYTSLLHYRVPIFSRLGREYELTVTHSGKAFGQDSAFQEIVLPMRTAGPFTQQIGLRQIVDKGDYQSIVFFADLSYLSIIRGLLLCPREIRRLTWGLWTTKSAAANIARRFLAKSADGNIFYCSGHARAFADMGVAKEKIWVARNTVPAARTGASEERNVLLFIGTMNERKRCDLAIRAFAKTLPRIPPDVKMLLVGDGPAKFAAQAVAEELRCSDRVAFHPGTTDPKRISDYYSRALAAFSVGQAGLSVLQSLGHGVGFITVKGAISGGETENLIDGYNSVLCEPHDESVERAFEKVCVDQKLARRLGENAGDYYEKFASIDKMAEGFMGAIENQPHCCETGIYASQR